MRRNLFTREFPVRGPTFVIVGLALRSLFSPPSSLHLVSFLRPLSTTKTKIWFPLTHKSVPLVSITPHSSVFFPFLQREKPSDMTVAAWAIDFHPSNAQTSFLLPPPSFSSRPKYPFLSLWVYFSPLSSLALFSFSFVHSFPPLHCPPEFPRPVWVSLTKKTRSDNEKKRRLFHNKTENTLNEIKEDGGGRRRRAGGE